MKVAGIVLNYNGKDLTLKTLSSLKRVRYKYWEIIVVDNGSTDGSYEAIKSRFADVLQVRKEPNEGISPGINLGLEVAYKRGADFMLVMNNDIEVKEDMVDILVENAYQYPECSCYGPKVYYYEDRNRIWSAGGKIVFREAVTFERGMGKVDKGQWNKLEIVDYISGCAVMIRRSVLEKIGLWDETYFLGVEDADWCYRAKLAGFPSLYIPYTHMWHMVSPSLGTYTPFRNFHTARSTVIFLRKFARIGWVSFFICFSLAIPLAALRELPRKNTRAVFAKIKGAIDGLRTNLKPIKYLKK